jgi:hypothetical protein
LFNRHSYEDAVQTNDPESNSIDEIFANLGSARFIDL